MIILNHYRGFGWTMVLRVFLLSYLLFPSTLSGQVSPFLSGQLTTNGVQIRTLSLTGNPFFPPIRTNHRTLFTADNRRLYILSSQSLGFIPFSRRIASSLDQLDPFLEDLSFVRLTNNTYHLVDSHGILTRNLTDEQFTKLRVNHLPNQFQNSFVLAPGGYSIHLDGTLSLLNKNGRSWIDLRIPHRRITSVINILSPTQVLVTIGSNPQEPLNQQPNPPPEVGLIQFFSSNRQIIPGERLTISGSLPSSTNVSARLFHLPKNTSQNLLGIIYDTQTTHPWQITTLQNHRVIWIKNLITQELREFVLPELIGPIQECVFLDQHLYCRTSAWQMFQVDFLATNYFHIPSSEISHIVKNHIQALRGIQNSFQEAILQNPSDFSRYLDRVRSQDELTIEQINGLFRIYSYPLRTGQFLNPSLRLDVLGILSNHSITSSELMVFVHLLRFEYDVQAGIELIKLIENQFWPILYTHRTDLHQFLIRRASQLQFDHLEYLVDLYRRMQQIFLSQSLDQIFPENLWTGILDHQPNQRNRNLILFR